MFTNTAQAIILDGMILRLFLFSFFVWTPWIDAHTVTEHGTVYFSPEDCLDKRLIEYINKETKSIYMAVYCFTHRAIAQALIEAHKRGVHIEVIVDRFSVKIKSPMAKLIEEGISVYVWDPPPVKRQKSRRSLMHNKFCLFGDTLVWTGSFNFTYEGSTIHQENAVLFEDAQMGVAFKNQFTTIKLRSCVPFSSYVVSHHKKRAKER